MSDWVLVNGKYWISTDDLKDMMIIINELEKTDKVSEIKNKYRDKYVEIIKAHDIMLERRGREQNG
jgi:hypothetical protein